MIGAFLVVVVIVGCSVFALRFLPIVAGMAAVLTILLVVWVLSTVDGGCDPAHDSPCGAP